MNRLKSRLAVIAGGLFAASLCLGAETVSSSTVSGVWDDSSRWSAGVPTALTDAVLAAPANAVATRITGVSAVARSLVLSNVNMNASVQILDGGSLTLYGDDQVAGKGAISGGSSSPSGSVFIGQTNTQSTVLNASSLDVFSFIVTANGGTAYYSIPEGQLVQAVNAIVGNGGTGAGGRLELNGGSLSLGQWLTVGNDSSDSGAFVLNGGELSARFGIRAGNSSAPVEAQFVFNDGRITSANMEAVYKAASPGVLEIQLAGSGMHEFYAAAAAPITFDASARLTDKPGGQGSFLKTGPETMTLNTNSSYSGGTTVRGGALVAQADGALGSGDVTVETAILTCSGGVTNDYLGDSAQLILNGSGAALTLDFEGTDTVSAVSLDGGATWLAAGLYDAAALDLMGTGIYSGDGTLEVTSTPGVTAVPVADSDLWDLSSLRTNPVVMATVSSNVLDGIIREEVHFFVTNTAGTVDRFYACVSRPAASSGDLPLFFVLHGGGGHASPALANVPISNLPAGQQAVSISLDYGTSHETAEELALHTLYGDPVPASYSTSTDPDEEILYRDMMGFRRILDVLLEQGGIDTNRVTVFGTSWGGFRTMLWAGLDSRIDVAAAAPGGGGMRDSLSNIGSQVAAIPESVRERWYEEFDPLSHAADVQAQVYFEAPANDRWFWLDGIQQNLEALPTDSRWVIVPNDDHGNGAPNAERGWTWPFVMNALFDGTPWPQVDEDSLYSQGLTYEWETLEAGIESAVLWFSPGSQDLAWPARYWLSVPAQWTDGAWTATLPNQFFEVAGKVFVSVTDTNGFRACSSVQDRGGRDPQLARCTLWDGDEIWDHEAAQNSWRPIDSVSSEIAAGSAAGSVQITPNASGGFAVCNNSVLLAAPYASVRQGIRLGLNGNGESGPVTVDLYRGTQTPAVSVFRASVTVPAGSSEIIIPWSAFAAQGDASGSPVPFDGLALSGTRTNGTPLTIELIDFYEQQTAAGVPHWWLQDLGFTGDMEAAAAFDDDADGMTAGEEYFAGTDPALPESVFRVSLAMESENQGLLEWGPVAAGRSYTVERTSDLQDGFAAETSLLDYPAASHPVDAVRDADFFRVAVDYTGTVRAAESYLPAGVAVVDQGEDGMRMVRYNDDGELVDLRVFGVNWYDAFSRYMEDGTDRSYEDGFTYLQAHQIPVARVHLRGFGPIGWSLYFTDKDEYFRRLDEFVAAAEAAGIGLLLDLFGGLDIGEIVDDAVAAGYIVPGIDFIAPDPLNTNIYGQLTYAEYRTALGRETSGSNAFISYFTDEVVSRYKDSPAVWGWEFANESNNAVDLPNIQNYRPEPAPALGYYLARDDSTVPAWTSADDITREHVRTAKAIFARSIRTVDSWRFICSGDSRPRPTAYNNWKYHNWDTDTRAEIVQVLPMDNPAPINTASLHIYQPTAPYFADDPVSIAPVTGDYEAFLTFFRDEALSLGQPMLVGEWGAPGDGTSDDEKTTFNRFLQALVDTEIQMSLLWNFDNRNTGQTDTFWVNPGTDKEYQLTNDDPGLLDLEQVNTTVGRW
jgi:autotransporter-associated beta strand protein